MVKKRAIVSDRWLQVDRKDLHPAPWNYKEDAAVMQEKLDANIRRNGQVENIIVREREEGGWEVINGNHRLISFELHDVNPIMVYNAGNISLAAAQRLALETNETKFERDGALLLKVIDSVVKEFPIEELEITMPFGAEEMAAMVELANYTMPDFEEEEGAGNPDPPKDDKTVTCPHCGASFDLKKK